MGLFDFSTNKTDNSEEVEKTITNNLETLLKEAAIEPALRPLFYKTLLEFELIVITNELTGAEGIKTVGKDTNIKIMTMSDGKVPVFTSTDRIFDNKIIETEVQFIGMAGRALLETTKGATLVINPFSDYSKELTPSEIMNLLNGTFFQPKHTEEIKKDTKIRIGQPAQIPDGMEKSILIYSKTRSEIEAVYIAILERVGSGEYPSLLIALKANHKEDEILGEIGKAIQPHIPKGEHIDFMKISNSNGLSDYFDTVEPTYKKELTTA